MDWNTLVILLLINFISLFLSTNACQVFNIGRRQFQSGRLSIRKTKFNYIQPGTKWCGAGNKAENFDDLGHERETDKCCRDHDFCPDLIEAGETKYNLTNEVFYSRLSCECDQQFQECLRATKKRTADNIGTVYFNALGTKCFRKDYPIVACVKRGGWLNGKCIEYIYNTSETKRYQWFDVIDY